MVDVIIPTHAEAVRARESLACCEVTSRYLSSLLKGGWVRDLLTEAIADAKQEARANNLTDADAELEGWRAE